MKRYCSECGDELPDDWDEDICEDCLEDLQDDMDETMMSVIHTDGIYPDVEDFM